MPKRTNVTAREIAGGCVAYRTRRLGRLVTRIYDEALRPHDLRATQLNLLVAITLLDGASPAVLSRELGLEKSTLSRNLAILEDRGWIAIERSGGGGGVSVHATDSGGAKLQEIRPAWKIAQKRARTELGDELFETLSALR